MGAIKTSNLRRRGIERIDSEIHERFLFQPVLYDVTVYSDSAMIPFFRDRRDAGRRLAAALANLAGLDDAIVLALPRGGVPVAFEVAEVLRAPLDLMLVRKLGVPGEEELAMGAVALPDVVVLNDDVIKNIGIPPEVIDAAVEKESAELAHRNRLYRGGEPMPVLKKRTAILIDDGVATGATMQAAIDAVRRQKPRRIVVAVPVASPMAQKALEKLADEVVCLHAPPMFLGVGGFYENFKQTSDEEVVRLLEQARSRLLTRPYPSSSKDT